MDVVVTPAPVEPMAAPPVSERAQARRETLRVLMRRPAFIFGNIVIIGWVITAVLGERITPYDPFNYFTTQQLPPSPEHWMGTDRLGRDVLSRVMVGSRDVLIVAPLAAMLGVIAGTLLGLVMGYYRGRVDDVLSRLVEAFLALPVILVALLTLVVLGSSPIVVVGVVGILFTPIVARTVRSAVLSERELDYVTAAKLRGETGRFILTREIFPNVL
jgi:peptide/nickel transport system permease protein